MAGGQTANFGTFRTPSWRRFEFGVLFAVIKAGKPFTFNVLADKFLKKCICLNIKSGAYNEYIAFGRCPFPSLSYERTIPSHRVRFIPMFS